jgi:hypothetical protein
MELPQINIYRMIHIENIPHILQYGITHKNSAKANPDYVSIGDRSLIDTRSRKQVYVDNGDFSKRNEIITLGDFIPFYFGIRMPMLYVMQRGGNDVEKATPAENIIYLVCRVIDIIESKIPYYFSDGHATDSVSSFYDRSKIAELPNLIDWNAIKSHYWSGEENLFLKFKKQAEFLVADDIPSHYLFRFVCYNEKAQANLVAMGIAFEKIKIFPTAYY